MQWIIQKFRVQNNLKVKIHLRFSHLTSKFIKKSACVYIYINYHIRISKNCICRRKEKVTLNCRSWLLGQLLFFCVAILHSMKYCHTPVKKGYTWSIFCKLWKWLNTSFSQHFHQPFSLCSENIPSPPTSVSFSPCPRTLSSMPCPARLLSLLSAPLNLWCFELA